MKVFFTSFEAFGDGRRSSDVYVPMNRLLSERLADRSYGAALDGSGWFLMFVFQREGGPKPRGAERTLYQRKSAGIDFRLHADPVAWRTADEVERRRLLYDVIRRTFDILRTKRIPKLDVDAFERDVEEIAVEQGWAR